MVTFDLEQLKATAPSIFAEEPASRVSSRYRFIPTTDILDTLSEAGWEPWKAVQVKSRSPELYKTAKHMIRLRHDEVSLDSDGTGEGVFPEILLVNSHDGLSSYQLRAGIFRMVCANGMVVSKEDFGAITICHHGFDSSEVFRASEAFCENASRLNDTINRWRDQVLSRGLSRRFAMDAARIRFTNPGSDIIDNLLSVNREEDNSADLWTVFNRTQENLLQGGFLNETTRRRVRPIKSIQKDLRINSELWELASNYSRELTSNAQEPLL
mgnify:CR=1 FL=1